MIAIAWVDTAEGRRWVIGRAAMLMVPGIFVWTIGRLVDRWVMQGGIGMVLFGAVMIVWALVHPSRGMPVRVPSASKPCVVPGCDGAMQFQPALTVADAPHTLEWPWRPCWRCAKDSAHVQLIAADEAREIVTRTRSFDRPA